ncbi:hypothetical protein [Amycolatopsis sp. NPDC051372]|uniref:hypothetical protein n=1 Tax=Amycolatopsis sp. NPDC051372 TaxID=3155669 RepID=UPI0034129255
MTRPHCRVPGRVILMLTRHARPGVLRKARRLHGSLAVLRPGKHGDLAFQRQQRGERLKTQTRTRHEAARYAREHDWI